MPNAIRFKQTQVSRQNGELARLKVVQGPDYGAVYVICGARATIGRGEENDIIISDLKASRVHAELKATSLGWRIKDLKSANGILLNGASTQEASLKINDRFTVGETTLEFITSEVGTMMLVAPPRSMDQLQVDQRRLDNPLKIPKALSGLNSTQNSSGSNENNLKKILVLGVLGVFLYLFLGDTDRPRSLPIKKSVDHSKDLASFLPQLEKNKTAEIFFKDGFREYLAGNYSRARTQFETVLQISPGNTLATLYLENCNNSLNSAVKNHLENGKKSYQAGRLREAKAHFEGAMRLLYRDQSSPSYVEAKDQFEKTLKEMKGEDGG